MNIETIVNKIIDTEKGFVDHPSDRGGPTRYGITEAVARQNGYTGPMAEMPREVAVRIYTGKYITGPGFMKVVAISAKIGYEMIDSGVLCGQVQPIKWLQRSLNAFNQRGRLYPDINPDGLIGPATLTALSAYLAYRKEQGIDVMVESLNTQLGSYLLDITEARDKNEDFIFGWFAGRVMT